MCILLDLGVSMNILVENGPNNGEIKVRVRGKKVEGMTTKRRGRGFYSFSPPVQSSVKTIFSTGW